MSRALPDTGSLDYSPSDERWVCDDHGLPECKQTEACRALPWEATCDLRLGAFMDWADAQFRRIVGPFDRGEVDQMPDEAFDAYSPNNWPSEQFESAAGGSVRDVARTGGISTSTVQTWTKEKQ